MPARKSGSSDSAAENTPPPAEPVPMISRADVAGTAPGVSGTPRTPSDPSRVAPEPAPLADDQEEVTLPDGTKAVVDKAYAEAMKATAGKDTPTLKQFPGGAPAAAPDAANPPAVPDALSPSPTAEDTAEDEEAP